MKLLDRINGRVRDQSVVDVIAVGEGECRKRIQVIPGEGCRFIGSVLRLNRPEFPIERLGNEIDPLILTRKLEMVSNLIGYFAEKPDVLQPDDVHGFDLQV